MAMVMGFRSSGLASGVTTAITVSGTVVSDMAALGTEASDMADTMVITER